MDEVHKRMLEVDKDLEEFAKPQRIHQWRHSLVAVFFLGIAIGIGACGYLFDPPDCTTGTQTYQPDFEPPQYSH